MFENKVVVVTGGTRGIGYATVEKFLKEGASVILFGSSETSVARAISQLKEKNSKYEVSGKYPSLANLKQITEAMNEIEKKYGKIDILVNNAGISSATSIYDYDEIEAEKIINVNLKGVFNCSKAAAEIMKKNGGGVIVNTSSMVSLYGQAAGSMYPATKGAVNLLTKSLARELGKDNIRVNAVAPGVIHTDMVDALSEEMIEHLLASIPLGRMGTPEDIANAIAFLASDEASYISGTILSVDGATIS